MKGSRIRKEMQPDPGSGMKSSLIRNTVSKIFLWGSFNKFFPKNLFLLSYTVTKMITLLICKGKSLVSNPDQTLEFRIRKTISGSTSLVCKPNIPTGMIHAVRPHCSTSNELLYYRNCKFK
jgi:hypothetical protein